jgi:hypothetical protein
LSQRRADQRTQAVLIAMRPEAVDTFSPKQSHAEEFLRPWLREVW